MKQEIENLYKMLKGSGELFELFEDMTGDWEKDKIRFKTNYDTTMGTLEEDDFTNF